MTTHPQLKVKIKSLAAEAAFIRREERKTKKERDWVRNHQGPNDIEKYLYGQFRSLHEHRVCAVRNEARNALLAYSYLRGKLYAETEPLNSKPIDIHGLASLCKRFGLHARNDVLVDTLKAWIAAAYPEPVAATPRCPPPTTIAEG